MIQYVQQHKVSYCIVHKGDVTHKRRGHPGKHEPLVAPEVWYQVQSVLDAHQSAADAHSVHDHYLKGTV